MNFLIADSFVDSLGRLSETERKAVKTSAFDLQMNPANPGFSFHKLERSRDKNFWSVRVSDDIRLIVHRGKGSLLLCYVDHHDKAYLLAEKELTTLPSMFTELAEAISANKHSPFDFIVVDESQDINVPQLRFLAAIGGTRLNSMFFAGDLGQRIFQQPFSWKSLGVDIRGRSRELRVNYRTSHQIRQCADRLLDQVITDADGNTENRAGTVSVFNGSPPAIISFDDMDAESAAVANWLENRVHEGVSPHEIGVFVRSEAQFDRARGALETAGLPYRILDEQVDTVNGQVSISTMHLAKGLEFRSVVIIACDDEIIPLQERIESVGDDADLQEVYETERHLLYVACTRARDHLLVTSVKPQSEFLDDLDGLGSAAPEE